ncbi:glutathione S-transferase [Aliikangiella maris]|uniref:Glutathione S-transferase n=2 Tax=Aliikangiella maris TaxID=3162458 RepID=A0ABV2BR86_9GAMM
MEQLPVLYSFRRCPYAIRTRMVLFYCHIPVELREVVLKNKPPQMMAVSPKGTVPVLLLGSGEVIDESYQIILWALQQVKDESLFYSKSQKQQNKIQQWIEQNDTVFKSWLDKYKYAVRFPEASESFYRQQAEVFLIKLENSLAQHAYIIDDQLSLADIMIAPFIRQFAYVNIDWFKDSQYVKLNQWLFDILKSPIFTSVMSKYQPWKTGDEATIFPA